MRLQKTRLKGEVVWPSEDPNTITPDLWVGFLGPAVALGMNRKEAKTALFSKEWFQGFGDKI